MNAWELIEKYGNLQINIEENLGNIFASTSWFHHICWEKTCDKISFGLYFTWQYFLGLYLTNPKWHYLVQHEAFPFVGKPGHSLVVVLCPECPDLVRFGKICSQDWNFHFYFAQFLCQSSSLQFLGYFPVREGCRKKCGKSMVFYQTSLGPPPGFGLFSKKKIDPHFFVENFIYNGQNKF